MEPKKSRSDKDSLPMLEVITRMEIGPVEVERRRFKAPYKVIHHGKEEGFDLIYRFEEDVFDPEEVDSINLANMVAVQVAINYGLFCKEMIFHGAFDQADRVFITEMMQNTACEIFVKKFIEPNPFLRGPGLPFPPVKQKSYLRAEIIFADEPLSSSILRAASDETFGGVPFMAPSVLQGAMNRAPTNIPHLHLPVPKSSILSRAEYNKSGNVRGAATSWMANRSRHAVLCSGGKDSLLSFGLLKEIGCETHPIFINESGRHWFTALNAYRHFVANYSGTARVWTNSDRLFNWMLRRLPFVRQDFAKVRSDEYPIRLWTVAVFLFGALPILRKRGIGRLVIGDEFDTTRKLSYHGIPHYDGLYDQSLYFDNALTRYFHQKGWGVCQFSLLRPLSEMLIEKILVQRYPELQRTQVSCHAAHTDGGRVLPCGQCEKCRRIVGMLMALGADPSQCGYQQPQSEKTLKALATQGVHQIAGDVQHLAFLLAQKGLIPKPSVGSVPARKRPELMKVRFDPESSPPDAIPVDLREPLFRIFLEHSDGAARRNGRVWIDFDPF